MTDRPRLFVGIALDEAVRAGCVAAAARLRSVGFPAKYERRERLHATLAFLGNVDPSRVAPIESAMNEIAQLHRPFDVVLDRVGAFPHERKPSIVFVGSRQQGGAFRSLAYSLRSAYRALGFEFTDAAVLHITIARVNDGPRKPLPIVELSPMVLRIDTLTLFESIPSETETHYTVRCSAPLNGDVAPSEV